MQRAVSVMAAFLALIVPVSAAPLVPALRSMRDSLRIIADAVC